MILGVTGSPGVGKSCLVDRLVQGWLDRDERVAIIAIDPSSALTGGALLGDRMRMQSVDDDERVYLRSIATRNHSGGLPARIGLMLQALAVAGYPRIIIETVGAGQTEIRIVAVAELILFVDAPGRGDIIQAEKAGLLELADLVVVNKADRKEAAKTASELESALRLAPDAPQVLLASAQEGTGFDAIITALDSLQPAQNVQRARWRERLLSAWEAQLLDSPVLEDLLDQLMLGKTTVEDCLTSFRGGAEY
jgi:LAO/AO transport system kinase